MRFDGTDPGHYSYLRDVDRAGLMWEFARRDPTYVAWYVRATTATGSTTAAPLRWGLLLAEDPERPAPEARILWHADLDPATLRVRAYPVSPRNAAALPLEPLRNWLSVAVGRSGLEHAVLSDGFHHLRIDVAGGTLAHGAVALEYQLPQVRSWDANLLGLRRLMALCVERRFPDDLFPSEPHANRWLDLFRVTDAIHAGASHRDIAEILFGLDRTRAEWQGRSDFLRSRVRRLVGEASRLADGGYRWLMRKRVMGERRRATRKA